MMQHVCFVVVLLVCIQQQVVCSPSTYISLAQDANGVWWLSQNGKLFTTRGVNHVNNGGMDDGVGGREKIECNYTLCGDTLSFSNTLKYAPYYNSTMARYGSEAAWATNTANRLTQWGFNTIGGWSATVVEKTGLHHYAHLLDIGTTWLRSTWLPDLFEDAFLTQCDQICKKEVAPRANDTNLIGYQTDNELGWFEMRFLFNYLQMPTTAAGYKTAITFLVNKYVNITTLDKSWNIKANSWEDIRNHLTDASINMTAFNIDANLFLTICAEQYFSVTTSHIRKYDTNHLLLGVRFSELPMEVLLVANKYQDLFDQHVYDYEVPVAWLTQIHQITKKPVMIGEFSFTAVDSNMPNTRGALANHPLTTQSQRANAFTHFVTELMQLPFAVGYHWWQWADEPSSGRWPDGEDSNYGLVHIDDDEYQLLTAEMTKTNAQIDKMHAQSHLIAQ